MKLTTARLKKLIREELEKKKKEEQMDESLKGLAMGVIAGLASLTAAYNIASTDTTSPETVQIAKVIEKRSAPDIEDQLNNFDQKYPNFKKLSKSGETNKEMAEKISKMKQIDIERAMESDLYKKYALDITKTMKESKRRS